MERTENLKDEDVKAEDLLPPEERKVIICY